MARIIHGPGDGDYFPDRLEIELIYNDKRLAVMGLCVNRASDIKAVRAYKKDDVLNLSGFFKDDQPYGVFINSVEMGIISMVL